MITFDTDRAVVIVDEPGGRREIPFDSPEAFREASRVWLRCGWDTKYVYSFTWLGRPIIQLPEDVLRIQEVIATVQPDVIVETGVAHGGSLVFYATLCKALSRGRVVGVDVEIRPHNRRAIEAHVLAPLITLVEGSSIEPGTIATVRGQIGKDDRVLVVLDSNHTAEHVLAELRAYAPLVTEGSYIIVADGVMQDLVGAPRSKPDWAWNNPRTAVREFLASSRGFVREEPAFPFNEGAVTERVTYWPEGFLRRTSA